jgi:hypothetical protein
MRSLDGRNNITLQIFLTRSSPIAKDVPICPKPLGMAPKSRDILETNKEH